MLLDYLTEKPGIGIASGFGSGMLAVVQPAFADENLLHLVAALGVWGGALVAGLTLVLKAIELFDVLRKRLK